MAIRVLVADDDTDLGQLIARYLSRSGFEADAVGSTREAAARLGSYQVVIIDVGLDGARGVELAREVWESSPGHAVVFISGHPFDIAAFEDKGARVAFLLKPFQPARLLDSIRTAAGQ